MNETLIKLLQENPFLVYIALGIILVALVAIFVLAKESFQKGIPFELFGLKVGKDRKFSSSNNKVVLSPSLTQSPIINVYTTEHDAISDEQIARIIKAADHIRQTTDDKIINKYLTPPLGNKTSYIQAIPLDIRERLSRIVLSIGGGWAGCSIAPLEIYLDYGRKYIGEDLFQKIEDLLMAISIYRHFEEYIPDQDLIKIQYLNADINMELDKTYESLKEQGKIDLNL